MERFEKLLKQVEGYEQEITKLENGEVIIRLIPVNSEGDKAKYFTKITEQCRDKVKNWLEGHTGDTDREKKFLERVKKAVQRVNYDYWIANMEPSVTEGKIYYAKNKDVGRGFSSNQWKQMAENYAPERGSRLASLDELFIWYALRIIDGEWTLDYVANNSSSAGNYWGAPNATLHFEKTGARKCGGHYDGQGNTYKIVIVENCYAIIGGSCLSMGDCYPVADDYYRFNPCDILYHGSGVLALTK